MACNNCNSEQSITYTNCNPCTPPADCSCAVLIKTSCVNVYDGDDLECAGIESGVPLNDVLKAMDAHVCAAIAANTPAVNLENIGTGAGVYAQVSPLGKRQLRKLKSSNSSVSIVEGVSDIDITVNGSETKIVAGTNTTVTGTGTIASPYSINANIVQETYSANNVGEGAEVFLSQTGTNPSIFNFRKIKKTTLGEGGIEVLKSITNSGNEVEVQTKSLTSSTLSITNELTVAGAETGNIKIELPTAFSGTDYYVNGNYGGAEETGGATKPFKTLKRCVDVILNRSYQNTDPFSWVDAPNPEINSENPYTKWALRPGINDGAVRVIIQSYTETEENLAINRVEYFLERGVNNSFIGVPPTSNLEYIFDMKPLVEGIDKVAGTLQLPYDLTCSIKGEGTIFFGANSVPGNPQNPQPQQVNSTSRKGYFRAYGHSNGIIEQPDSNLIVGSEGGRLQCKMFKKTGLTYTPLTQIDNTTAINRESINMTGYQTLATPDYGAIVVEKANAQFRESLFLSGLISIEYSEQHGIYLNDFGAMYGESGRIYMRRDYQHVNFSTVENIDVVTGLVTSPANATTRKMYTPSTHVHDISLKNGATINYAGDFYTQENTGATQGGSESFVCLENSTTQLNNMCTFNANGGGIIKNLLYNHYVKSILNSIFEDTEHHTIAIKNLNLDSILFKEAISIVNQVEGTSSNSVSVRLIDVYVGDYFVEGVLRKPFSNRIINTNLFIPGTPVSLQKGTLNPNIPTYLDNAAAVADSYSIGGIYRVTDTGDLKVVI